LRPIWSICKFLDSLNCELCCHQVQVPLPGDNLNHASSWILTRACFFRSFWVVNGKYLMEPLKSSCVWKFMKLVTTMWGPPVMLVG
jgi:hypothetical protein